MDKPSSVVDRMHKDLGSEFLNTFWESRHKPLRGAVVWVLCHPKGWRRLLGDARLQRSCLRCSCAKFSWCWSLVSSQYLISMDECRVGECWDLWVGAVWRVGSAGGGWRCCWNAPGFPQLPPATPKNPPPSIASLLLFCFLRRREQPVQHPDS